MAGDKFSGSFDSSSVAMRSLGVAQEDRWWGDCTARLKPCPDTYFVGRSEWQELGGYLFALLTQKICHDYSSLEDERGLTQVWKRSLVFHPARFWRKARRARIRYHSKFRNCIISQLDKVR